MSHRVELMSDGNVWRVLVSVGDTVKQGDTLLVMEVMKMEVPHEAPGDGTVSAVHVAEGDEGLAAGTLAVEID